MDQPRGLGVEEAVFQSGIVEIIIGLLFQTFLRLASSWPPFIDVFSGNLLKLFRSTALSARPPDNAYRLLQAADSDRL